MSISGAHDELKEFLDSDDIKRILRLSQQLCDTIREVSAAANLSDENVKCLEQFNKQIELVSSTTYTLERAFKCLAMIKNYSIEDLRGLKVLAEKLEAVGLTND